MQVICETCKKPFDKLPRYVQRTSRHFCSKSCAAKGSWWNSHRRNGNTPLTVDMLESKIERIPFSGCWIWTGHLNKKDDGYANLVLNQKNLSVHRAYYEMVKGKIPDGLDLDHLCRVHCCINPDHLEAVTTRENVLRGIGPAARYSKRTHCINGHEYTEENTREAWDTRPYRQCRKCQRRPFLREFKLARELTETPSPARPASPEALPASA